MDFVIETDPKRPLPPPKQARETLKRLAVETLKAWVKEFGSGYKKLDVAYKFLKLVKGIDFDYFETRSEVQRRRDEAKKRKSDNVWKERVKKVKAEMEEMEEDFDECITQTNNCIGLLVPTIDNFGFASEEGGQESVVVGSDDPRLYGVVSGGQSLTVEIDAQASPMLEENGDNCAVLENLRDQFAILTNKLLPMVKKWAVILSKAGQEISGPKLLMKAIDLKQQLETIELKARRLNVDLGSRNKRAPENGSEDSSDGEDCFIEVKPKEGYEENVVEPELFPMDEEPKPSTSGLQRTSSSSSSWSLNASRGDETQDPTTFQATLSKMGRGGLTVNSPSSKLELGKKEAVPKVPFDVDLMNWGEKAKPQTVAIDSEKLRFWGSGRDEEVMVVPGSDIRERAIEFTGIHVVHTMLKLFVH